MLPLNPLYEVVPCNKELPAIDKSEPDWEILEWSEDVFVNTSNGISHGFYAYREKVWYSKGKPISDVVSWLRPLPPERMEEWVREIAGKAFKAGFNYRCVSESPEGSLFVDNLINEMSK